MNSTNGNEQMTWVLQKKRTKDSTEERERDRERETWPDTTCEGSTTLTRDDQLPVCGMIIIKKKVYTRGYFPSLIDSGETRENTPTFQIGGLP